MKFYKADPIAEKPFIRWNEVAKNIDELIALGLENDPLILPYELVPSYQFAVCPLKIEAGELVPYTLIEMNAFEASFDVRQSIIAEADKIKDINKGTFLHAGNLYPMHEVARLRYMACALDAPANQNFMDVTGVVRTILEADLPTFLNKYYKEIQLITNVAP